MQIIHPLNDFLLTLFPKLSGLGHEEIVSHLEEFYSVGPFKPVIKISDDLVYVEIDTPAIANQSADYKRVIALCEQRKYDEAKGILRSLLHKNPSNSEYHRIMGQILSDQGEQEEAINSLIDALRWNSRNGYALIMMGNIFAREKDDLETAMKYYDQATKINPADNIAINNIGANLMQQGNFDKAKEYFERALLIDPKYPNTHYALGMIAENENDLDSAFYSFSQAVRLNNAKDELYKNSIEQEISVAKKIVSGKKDLKWLNEYRHRLEFESGTEIEIVEDKTIPTAAKIEFAENYDRAKHLLKYHPNYPAVEHLIMHELVHLDFVIQARKEKINELFISTQEHKKQFIETLAPTIKNLNKIGVKDEAIGNYCTGLFEGLNRQIYNGPIDLFIEDFLYNEYPQLRAYQFLSLFQLVQESIKAVTDKKVVEVSPKHILSLSKIFNIVNAIQFKNLFGIDFIMDFKATPSEFDRASNFYDEFLEYKDDRKPAEEYELVRHWAEDLKLQNNFELVNEHEYRTKRTDVDNLLNSIESDPLDLKGDQKGKQREMETFQQSQAAIGLNMAVVMFMIDAMQYFSGMQKENIKKIAFEIALQGTQGYRPEKNDYRINSIPGKKFSGYHILAYYYVSWMMSLPEMVPDLKLPYEKEYALAGTMFKQQHK